MEESMGIPPIEIGWLDSYAGLSKVSHNDVEPISVKPHELSSSS